MPTHRSLHSILSIIVILTLLFSGARLPSASAQGPDGIERQINPQTGKVSFIGPENGQSVAARDALDTGIHPQDPAMALAKRFGPEFGVKDPARDLSEAKDSRSENGRITTRYQQNYQGIPVMGGELIVNTNVNGDLYSMNGEVSPNLSLSTKPTITLKEARQTALRAVAKWYQKAPNDFVASEPALWIYDESLLRPSTRPAELVWRMEVKAKDRRMPVRELVLVNAQRGSISLHFNQIDTAWAVNGSSGAIQDPDPTPSPTPTETELPTETAVSTETPVPTGTPIPTETVVPTETLVLTGTPIPTETGIPTETVETTATVIPTEEITPTGVVSTPNMPVDEVTTLAGATWYVTTTGNDSNSCSTPALPCATINAAIAKAVHGDVIKVANGTYYGTGGNVVTISKNITLSGGWVANFTAQTGASIIDGQNARNGILSIDSFVTVKKFIIQNSTSYDSGGIYVFDGYFTLENSTVRQNHAANRGGGIFLINSPTFYLINSTVSGNSAGVSGGGIYHVDGSVIITHSTVASNTADTGGGLYVQSGVADLVNSILADNSATGTADDCSGSIYASGSIVEDTTNCTFGVFSGSGNQINIDPKIDSSLTGTLPLHKLLAGSPAIDTALQGSCTLIDQRGMPRPRGGGCDVGAYEYAPTGGIAIISGSGQSARIGSSFAAPLVMYLVDSSGNRAVGVTITFTAPASGASGVFAGTNTDVATAVTDSNGQATSPIFTANKIGGSYLVSATVAGVSETANFNLTNYGNEDGLFVAPTGSDSNSCLAPSSPCETIQEAINRAGAEDTIKVATGTYTGTHRDGVVVIQKSITLSGGWNSDFTMQNDNSLIDGQYARRGIAVRGVNAVVVLDRFIIQNGTDNEMWEGGGIVNAGILTINNTTIRRNIVGGAIAWAGGGGIMNYGTLRLNNTTVSQNTASSGLQGGGILNRGTATLNNSTVSGNRGGESALYNSDLATLVISNSTITKNQSYGIYNTGGNWPGIVYLRNTTLAGNGSSGDCYGRMKTQGYNLVGIKPAGCTFQATTGDLVGTSASPINPRLTLLQDNGGWTQTHALLPGSPAINAGNPAAPGSGGTACLVADQRGTARPVGTRCDMGAYEGTVAWAPPYRVKTYTANHSSSLPGVLLCTQSDPACVLGNFRASAAHEHAIGTYTLYARKFLRNSLDNKGMTILSTVDYRRDANYSYDNAFWNGSQVVYGDDRDTFLMADDVVAHELTHGMTQYESNLFYYYQSGAINESISDIWGEYYDQINGQGDDTPSVKWFVGEDVLGPGIFPGPYRDMRDPTSKSHPDRMSSPYYCIDEYDNGCVHNNSGVNNKAAYLMVEGGTFNGKTVSALGWDKTLAIYYEANTKLLWSGADYSDLYYALQQACSNLIGRKGITTANCIEVKDALAAVEMNRQPTETPKAEAPLCAVGRVPKVVFADDLEAGLSNWTLTNGVRRRWQLDSPYGPYAQSGKHFLYADDYPATVTDATARLKPIRIPRNAYLHFAHAYDFEIDYEYGYNYDGGILEYSLNGGTTWLDAGSLIDYNGYKDRIFRGIGDPLYDNPLKGRLAFVDTSHGYISTRLNLASLAGKTVSFRWRIGLDKFGSDWGWWVDNIKVYTCVMAKPGAFNKTAPANGATSQSTSPTLTWGASAGATTYEYCYDTTNDNACTNWTSNGTSRSKVLSGLSAGTTYYWHVRARNSGGVTYSNSSLTAFWLFTTMNPSGEFNNISPTKGQH